MNLVDTLALLNIGLACWWGWFARRGYRNIRRAYNVVQSQEQVFLATRRLLAVIDRSDTYPDEIEDLIKASSDYDRAMLALIESEVAP